MKRFIFALIIVNLLISFASAQDHIPVPGRIPGEIAKSGQIFPAGKVFVVTDKDIYSPGEIIWFSGFVYDRSGPHLSVSCPELMVNLYDDSGNVINSDRFVVKDGKTNGDILLPGELSLGRYFLAAFSPFQTSPGDVFTREIAVDKYYEADAVVTLSSPERIYEAGKNTIIELKVTDFSGQPVDKFLVNYKLLHGNKTLAEGKVRPSAGTASIQAAIPGRTGDIPVELFVSNPRKLWTKKMGLKTSADEIKVRFYVEGENLVGLVPQKIGFYATAWNDIPVDLEADVISSYGQLLTKVKTFNSGFGLFPYKAIAGENDKLVITSEYGKGQTFKLPVIGEKKIAWSLFGTDEDNITADLLMAGNGLQKLAIAASKGYNLLWAANLEITKNSRIKIPAGELDPGIIRLEAFNDEGHLLTSRLVSVPGKKKLNIDIIADTPEPGKVKVTLFTTDENRQPVAATLALSIADIMRKTEKDIRLNEYILLGGELVNPLPEIREGSGQETAPDYWLISNELTASFRDDIPETAGAVPGGQLINNYGISGRVTDKRGNPAGNSKISILNGRNMQMFSVTADKTGYFEFSLPIPVDINDLTISAFDENGKGNLTVKTDPTFTEIVGIHIKKMRYLLRDKISISHKISDYLALNPALLSEQPSGKPIAAGSTRQHEEPYKTMLQSATSLLDVIRVIRPFTLIGNQIVFYGTINSINAQSGALIVIDGQKMGTLIDVLSSVNTHDVDKINISLDPMDIQKYTGFNSVGVIEIFTKKGEFLSSPETAKKKEILYRDGYRIPRDFLTSDALQGGTGRDMRTTLYWNPAIQTGPSGTITFSIPLSEIKSDFIISADGMSANGQAGHGQQVFPVR